MRLFPFVAFLALAGCTLPLPQLVPIPAEPGFQMSETEITNAQYEAFDPSHKRWRGYKGFSQGDDEAVIMVSWEEACVYCEWLSKKSSVRFFALSEI